MVQKSDGKESYGFINLYETMNNDAERHTNTVKENVEKLNNSELGKFIEFNAHYTRHDWGSKISLRMLPVSDNTELKPAEMEYILRQCSKEVNKHGVKVFEPNDNKQEIADCFKQIVSEIIEQTKEELASSVARIEGVQKLASENGLNAELPLSEKGDFNRLKNLSRELK